MLQRHIASQNHCTGIGQTYAAQLPQVLFKAFEWQKSVTNSTKYNIGITFDHFDTKSQFDLARFVTFDLS